MWDVVVIAYRQFTFAHIVAGSSGREEEMGAIMDLLRLLHQAHVARPLRAVRLRLQFAAAAAGFAGALAEILAKH